jgi:Zn-dependent peptidase ImmA (M78 family)/transcriptional regulator with XRE-family HTH domain
MKPGTPGFIGARLTEARETRGLSAVALAELVGVTRQAISLYEHDQQTPRPEVLQRLSDVLKVPEFFLIKGLVDRERSAFFFRSMSSATMTQRSRARRKNEWLYELAEYVQGFVDLPPVRLPAVDIPDDPARLSMNRIEEIAAHTRREWNIGDGPIGNVASLMEAHGIIMGRLDLGADELDGLSAWIDGRPCVLTNIGKPAARLRFDDAHELGHLLLHRKVDQARLNKAAEFKLIEDQAHRFAGAFLFPSTSFAAEVQPISLDRFRVLKTKWRTSIAMMLRRCMDLDFVSADQYRRLWIAYTRRGWRGHEPYDQELPTEAPRLLERSLRLLLKEGGKVPSDLVAGLARHVTDLEELAGLPQGYFSQPDENSSAPQLRGSTDLSASGQVVSLASRRPKNR